MQTFQQVSARLCSPRGFRISKRKNSDKPLGYRVHGQPLPVPANSVLGMCPAGGPSRDTFALSLSVSLSRKYIVRRNGKQDPLPIANMECATGALCVCVNRWDDARGYRMRELHNYAWRIKELVKRTVCVYLCAD